MQKKSSALKLTLLLVSSLTIMSIVTISPSLPEMSSAFPDIAQAEFLAKLVLTLPALFIALSSFFLGRYIDRYGRVKLLWAALLFYALAGTAGYYLSDLYHILISRAFLGIAVGVSMTVVITLIADYFDGQERQRFVGIQVAFMSIGGIVFIGLGGILADISWRLPFLIYGLSLVILPMAVIFLKEPVIEKSPTTLPQDIKVPKVIWLLFVNVLLMWVLFFLIPVQIPFHLKAIGVEQNSLIGAAIAMSTAFSAISAISYSRLKNKFSFVTIFSIGYCLMAIAFVLTGFAESYGLVVAGMMLAGLGMGMMIPNTNMWVMKITPPEIRGREIGKLTTFWFLGQFLSPIILWPLTRQFTISTVFYITAGFLLLLSLSFLLLKIRQRALGTSVDFS
jgi:MFS family permease